MKIATLHYISQGISPEAHLENIQAVCKAGGKWIQLRMKAVPEKVYLETALAVRRICDAHGAIFIVNDNIHVALASQADGVHLGQEDESPAIARKVLGAEKIIGGTANTLAQCQELITAGVDYIGLGPYRFTQTKEKLSPVLGLDGYTHILSQLSGNIPVIAIGGITSKDVKALRATGIHGVAVSGMLSTTQDAAVATQLQTLTTTLI